MKRIHKLFLLLMTAITVLTGCENEDPFITAGPNDTPRFLAPSKIEESLGCAVEINRDEPFTFDVVVTPANYTTIEWIYNGKVISTGTSINKEFLAGSHKIQIVATTVAGKVATRTINLTVKALDGDPVVKESAKNRWLVIGESCTMKGTNLENVKTVTLEKEVEETRSAESSFTVECTSASYDAVTFTLPAEMVEGSYRATAVVATGEEYGLGTVTVNAEPWKSADVADDEVLLFDGNNALNWDAENIKITAEQLADVAVDSKITITYTKQDASELAEVYWALRIITPSWSEDVLAQTDFGGIEGTTYEFVYDQHAKDLVEKDGAMCLVGNGLRITKITGIKNASSEKTAVLWEDEAVLNWDAENIKVTAEELAEVPVGAEITIDYTKMDASELAEVYWALRIVTPTWSEDVLAQTDFGGIEGTTYSFVYDGRIKSLIEKDGSMSLVGNGLRITKISYKVAAPKTLVLWEDEAALNWDAENIKVTAEELAEVSEGQTITITYSKMDASELAEVYWALRIVTPTWSEDVLAQTDFGGIEGTTYSFVYDDRIKSLIERDGSMSLVGNGLRITKIVAE